MSGRVLSEEEVVVREQLINDSYGCSMCTMMVVGNNVVMGSSDVITRIQKKEAQNLIATIRDRDKTISGLQEQLEMLSSVGFQNDKMKEWNMRLHAQNVILRDALESVMPDTSDLCNCWLDDCTPDEIVDKVRKTLTKVTDGEA